MKKILITLLCICFLTTLTADGSLVDVDETTTLIKLMALKLVTTSYQVGYWQGYYDSKNKIKALTSPTDGGIPSLENLQKIVLDHFK